MSTENPNPASPWAGGPWSIVIPVKPPSVGKSRLDPGRLGAVPRSALAAAFAMDTIAAAQATTGVVGVLVVTDDFRFADQLRGLGCVVIPDGVSGNLNGTLMQAAIEAVRLWPEAMPVALCADLPCLTAGDLSTALQQLRPEWAWFVGDDDGVGTTMYAALPPPEGPGFTPCFGVDSSRAHLESGARPVEGSVPTLRLDVDDDASLARAVALGVGQHTAAVLSAPPPCD